MLAGLLSAVGGLVSVVIVIELVWRDRLLAERDRLLRRRIERALRGE